ncbi:MAG TPA: flagellar biosynthetic protein FliO [Gammaproteobacteria bacterium]|nr:flagellar biosynthetic protein FliO [Gammaproteobacteria bacterium]
MTSEPASVAQLLQVLTSLVLVVGLIFGAAWLFRRYGRFHGMASEQVQVLAGVSVGQREKVIVLQAGDTQMLLGVAPGRVQTLHVFDRPVIETEKAAGKARPGFPDLLKGELKKKVGS